MNYGSIPNSWLGITGCMSAEPLLALLQEVNRRNIDHKNLIAVRVTWEEMNVKAAETVEAMDKRIAERRKAAQYDNEIRQDLDLMFPNLRNKRK